jgi:chromosome segregation ATPase
MSTKFQKLADQLAAELRDTEAQVTAGKTNLAALELAQNEISAQVAKVQQELVAASEELVAVRTATDEFRKASQIEAAAIRGEADRYAGEAAVRVKQAQEDGFAIIQEAQEKALAMDNHVAERKRELQHVTNEVNAARSQIGSLATRLRKAADDLEA